MEAINRQDVIDKYHRLLDVEQKQGTDVINHSRELGIRLQKRQVFCNYN